MTTIALLQVRDVTFYVTDKFHEHSWSILSCAIEIPYREFAGKLLREQKHLFIAVLSLEPELFPVTASRRRRYLITEDVN